MQIHKYVILVATSFLFVVACKPKPSEPTVRYASTELKVRKEPSAASEQIHLLVPGNKVTVLEEVGDQITISGVTGKWNRIQYFSTNGFVFSGFLSDKPVKYDLRLDSYSQPLPYRLISEVKPHQTCKSMVVYVYQGIISFVGTNCPDSIALYCKVVSNTGDDVLCDPKYKLTADYLQSLSQPEPSEPMPSLEVFQSYDTTSFKPFKDNSFQLADDRYQ